MIFNRFDWLNPLNTIILEESLGRSLLKIRVSKVHSPWAQYYSSWPILWSIFSCRFEIKRNPYGYYGICNLSRSLSNSICDEKKGFLRNYFLAFSTSRVNGRKECDLWLERGYNISRIEVRYQFSKRCRGTLKPLKKTFPKDSTVDSSLLIWILCSNFVGSSSLISSNKSFGNQCGFEIRNMMLPSGIDRLSR